MIGAPSVKRKDSSVRWRQYQKYKESGVEWLGEVPERWDIGRLKFYCSVNPSKSEIGFLPDDLEVSFLPMENLGEDHSLCLDLIKPLSEVWNGYTYFKENDVILAKITPCFENGKCSVCSGLKNKIGFGTTELHVLRALNSIIPRFCYYIVQNHAFKTIGTELMFGTTGQKRLPDSYVRDYKQGIPPLAEQHAIAAFLDRETARIDALILKKKRQIDLLQEKRAALISHAVTKGLDPNVKMRDSGIEWLGMVPEGWDVGRIRYFSKVLTGGTPNRDHPEYWDDGTIPWMSSGEVNFRFVTETSEKITSYALQNSNAKLLPVNSIMIALNGQGKTKGMAAILKIPAACNQSLAAIVCDPRKLHFFYLFFYLESRYKEIRGLVGDDMRDGLNLDIIRALPVYKPPLPEQHAIAASLDRESADIDGITKRIKDSIKKLEEYRSALISAAVTGKIDVRKEVSP